MTDQKGFINITFIIIVVLFASAAAVLIMNQASISEQFTIGQPNNSAGQQPDDSSEPDTTTVTTTTTAPAPSPEPSPAPTPTPEPPTPTTPEPEKTKLTVSLGQQFTLRKNQVATVASTGLEIEIIQFYNSPCPSGSQCIWSGVGLGFEYRFNGEVKKGIDMAQVFGHQVTIVKTDHDTYANLVVNL